MAEPTVARSLHVSHTGIVGGAERSLLTLLDGLGPQRVVGVACPKGELADAVRRRGLAVHHIRGTTGSLRLDPLRTPLAIAEIVQTGVAVARIAARSGATVLHANSVRAALATAIAARRGGPPAVIHVRDVLPDSRSARAVKRVALAQRGAVVCISRYVADRFAPGGRSRLPVSIVPNPVDLTRFDPARVDRAATRAQLRLPDDAVVVAMVGQITHWKGHDTAVRALEIVRRTHPRVLLLVVGSVKFDAPATRFANDDYLAELRRLVGELGLADAVRFTGEREDIPEILGAVDLLLLPSIEEPFGRSIIEAMAMGTPVIATDVGGPVEILAHRETGLLAPPREPVAWADAIDDVVERPDEAQARALRARAVAAERFAADRHARVMARVLDDTASGPRAPSSASVGRGPG
jgi:glycosyltransferase involved in cell wall biosynthesis